MTRSATAPRDPDARVVVSALECPSACASRGAGSREDADAGCRYQVAWSINPHMRPGAVRFARAAGQHRAFQAALRAAGAEVVELPFVHGAFDSVFAKDPAFLLERQGVRRALLASQRHPERRAEQLARARYFDALGYHVIDAPDACFEGGDVVVMPPGDGILLGHGPRTERRAAPWLERHALARVIPLELCDPSFFHLDVALSVLPDGTALVCEEAFTGAALLTLRALSAAGALGDIVPVARDDAMRFGLNLLCIGDIVLSGADVPRVRRILRARGFRPVVVPLDEFHLAGGSAACLAARVHRDPAERSHATPAPRIASPPPSRRPVWANEMAPDSR